jgi:dGTPase
MKNPLPDATYKHRNIPKEYPVRGEYFRDQTAILHSMEFRRLKHKTQVFFAPENDHICTRIEHVLHVATIAASICKGLNKYGWQLDIEMAFAMGLGHDLGHAPFGHTGEDALCEILGSNKAFIHEIHSYNVARYLSQDGQGMNLTYAVLDGIICHCGEKFEQSISPINIVKNLDHINSRAEIPSSFEGCILRFADKIAYLGRDLEDAFRVENFLDENLLPLHIEKKLGNKNGDIINHLVLDLIETSKSSNQIQLSDEYYLLMKDLKTFNYTYIYNHPLMLEYGKYCKNIIKILFEHFHNLIQTNKTDFGKYEVSYLKINRSFGIYYQHLYEYFLKSGITIDKIVTYYIAGMTDQFAIDSVKQICIPKPISFIN